jgi:hypothetical protein
MIPDLFDDFPDIPETKDYCDSRTYMVWEQDVAKPYIEAKGYTGVTFHMIEEDSFGPLIRAVKAKKDGVEYEWHYG